VICLVTGYSVLIVAQCVLQSVLFRSFLVDYRSYDDMIATMANTLCDPLDSLSPVCCAEFVKMMASKS